MWNRLLRSTFGVLLLLLCCCWFCSAESYSITEQQLQTLEKIQSQQQSLIQSQESTLQDLTTQINNLNSQLKSSQEYSKTLEQKVLFRNNVISISVGVGVGCIAGVITAACLK